MDPSSCFGGGCDSSEAKMAEIRLSYCEYEPPGDPSPDLKNNLLMLFGGLWTAVNLKHSPDVDANPSHDFLIAANAVQHILKRLGLWCVLQFVVITIEELDRKMVERMPQNVAENKDELRTRNDDVHNVLERIYTMLRSASVSLYVGDATEMVSDPCSSNLKETIDFGRETSMMSPSQTPPGVSFSTSLQVRMLRILLLNHQEELKAQVLPASFQALVFVNEQSTALVIHQFISEVLKPLICDYLLGDSKSPGLRHREAEAICAFETGKTHILVVVAGAGSVELPDVGLVIAFDDIPFEGGFNLEEMSKYLKNSNGSLILLTEGSKEDVGLKKLRKLSNASAGDQSHHSTTEKTQMEGGGTHSMAQAGHHKESIQAHLDRRLHRGRRDSTNLLEAKNKRTQRQYHMDSSSVATLTAEKLNLLEVSTLLCQQPSIFMELLIHPLSTTAVYNMSTLGCVKFEVGQPTEDGSPLPLGFATLKRLPKHIMDEFGLGEPSIYFGLKPEQVEKLIHWHRVCVDVFVRGKRPNISEIIMEYQSEEKNREEENSGDKILDKGYIFVPLKLSSHNGSTSSNPVVPSLDWTSIDAFLSTSEQEEEGDAAMQENPFDLEGSNDLGVVWCRISAKKNRMYFVMQAMSLTYGEYVDRLEEKRSMIGLVPPPSASILEHEKGDNKHRKVALGWESLVDDNFPPPIDLNVEEAKTLSLAEWYTPAQREATSRNQHLYLAYPAASAKEVFFHHVELTAYKLSNPHDIITTHVAGTTTLSTGDDGLRLGVQGGGDTNVNVGNDDTKMKFRHCHTGPPRMLIPQYFTLMKLPRMICGTLMMIGPLAYDIERCLAVHKFADEVFRRAVLNAGREWQREPATRFLSCALQHGDVLGERLELFGDHWLGFYIALYVILAVKEEELMVCYHADLVCNARLLVATKKIGIYSLLPSPRDWRPSSCAIPKDHSNLNWKTVPDVMEALIGCFVLSAGDYCGESLLECMGYHTVSDLLKCQDADKSPTSNLTTPAGTESMEEIGMSLPVGGVVTPGQNEATPCDNTNVFRAWPLCRGSFVHFQSVLGYGTIFPDEYISTCPGSDLNICVLQVEKALGYKFHIPWLCLQALTHRSSVEEDPLWLAKDSTAVSGSIVYVESSDNERLYFLGSYILNYIVMVHLYHLNTMLTPGDLTNLRSSITVSTRLNLLASDTLGLLSLFRGSPHVVNAVTASISGENNDNYTMAKEMSKVLKSLMAAIFLDSDGCLATVSDVFWPLLAPNNV